MLLLGLWAPCCALSGFFPFLIFLIKNFFFNGEEGLDTFPMERVLGKGENCLKNETVRGAL